MMMDLETQPLLSTLRKSGTNSNVPLRKYCGDIRFCCRQVCLQHKAVVLILVWTMIVGELLALQQFLIGEFVENYVPISSNGSTHFANSVSSPLAFFYAILAVMAMFYPLGGFLADIYCGRFKMVMIGLGFLAFSFSSIIVVLVGIGTRLGHSNRLLEDFSFKEVAPFYFIGIGTFCLAAIGIVAFQANFIQLGLDQLMDASSKTLSIFIHLAIWADVLGTTLVSIGGAPAECTALNFKVRIAWNILPILIIVSIPFLLILTCCKWQWFYTEPGYHNPYGNVLKVLNFARRHKYPLQRSAFTYSDDEKPSRIDFAKSRYGGPFTTEQVEDVKTFLRILTLLLSLGAIFVMEIPTSYIGFKIFGLHTGYREDFINRCKVWAIFESSALRYTLASIFLPIYTFVVLRSYRISIIARLYVGLLFYVLGTVSMLAIDLAGHLHSVDDLGTGSHCMFAYTRANKIHALKYPILKMPWGVLIIPNTFLAMGPPIIIATILEFISAQSPHSMKGLLIGVFFAINGFFQLISSIALVPISSDSIWSKGSIKDHPPVTNCCFAYFLFTIVVALFGFVVFSTVVKRYKYRERDDRPYDQSVVEEIFHRRNLMRSPTPDYDDLDA